MKTDKNKLSVLTKILIFFTICGIISGFIYELYINMISDGYALYYGLPTRKALLRIVALIYLCGFFCGIGGFIAEFKHKNNTGKIICAIISFSIFIFVGLCLPPQGTAYENMRRMSCASNIKQIHIALKQYAADYSGYFPPENGAVGLEYLRKYDYLTDYAVYTCPSALIPESWTTCISVKNS